jgi:dephospho-CoA kinase
MKVIGLTGGIGSGKTQVCTYLQEKYKAEIIMADDVGHELMEPGTECYRQLRGIFSEEYILENGSLDRKKIGQVAFHQPAILEKMNSIIHPAVWNEVTGRIERARIKGAPILIFEAALLLGTAYREICQEFWYVYAQREVRLKRLQEGRNISRERAESVMKSQPSEEEFRKGCDFVIDNSGFFSDTAKVIDKKLLEGYLQ